MQRLLIVIVAVVAGVIVVPLGASVGSRAAAQAGPVRILLYGDSITQGSSGDYTWRYRLDRSLRAAGVAFDLVGTRQGLRTIPGTGHASTAYADPAFDTDHAAWWGERFLTPVDDLSQTTIGTKADVVVGLIGFNDIVGAHATPASVIENWRTEIAQIRAGRPNTSIVLVQVPQVWRQGVVDYDAALVALAEELDTDPSPVIATDLPILDPVADTWDGTHPTASGENEIARVVEDGLAAIGIGEGSATGRVGSVANGPTRGATASAAAAPRRVTVSWHDVAGVTSEWVESRDATAHGPWTRVPQAVPAGTTAWTRTGLQNGHSYQFRLRPAKGTAISSSVTSPVVTAVPGPPPRTPRGLRVAVGRTGRIVARWNAVAAATSYSVAIRDVTSGSGWTWVATRLRTWHTTDTRAGHHYAVRVRAERPGARSAATSPVRVLVRRRS